MKISELQEILDKARYNHGNIEVQISRPVPLRGRVYDNIDHVVVKRIMKDEEVAITERLSKLGDPKLVLKHVPIDNDQTNKEDN